MLKPRHLVMILVLIGGASLSSQNTISPRRPNKYIIYGEGTISCGRLVSESSNSVLRPVRAAWVRGFISGYGYIHVGVLKETDADAINVWIDNYCHANPLEDVSKGAEALAKVLASTQ